MVKPRTFRFALVVVAASAAACQRAGAETVLLDFTSEHCPPCREMEPILRQLTSEGYAVRQVDVNRDRDLARRFSITVTPTFVVLVDGREWARLPSATSHRQLVEMLHKATELAHAHRPTVRGPSKAVGGAGVANVGYDAPQMGPTRAAVPLSDEPQEGRVVAIQNPFAPRSPDRAAAAPPSRSGVTGFETAASAEHLIAATVRLSVADPDSRSTGTGVVVDARNGFALVLTCGHLFRESQGEGAIQVSQFAAGPGGAELRGSVPGELLDFDLDRDLALVRFAVNGPVNVAPVAPPGTLLEPGAAATSVGCNHGDPPTPLATRITALNRYQGHPNVEAAGAPTEGRSGGGLFNGRGQLIGVCFAADPQGDEGLYASLTSIHEKLRELNMATVFEAPAGGGAVDAGGPMAVASAPPSPFAVRGQSPAATDSTTLPESWPSASAPTASAPAAEEATPPMALAANTGQTAPPAMTPDEQATLAEIARRGVGSEVICIIRPQSPDGRSDVIKISGASPAFVQALAAARTATSSGASAATAAAPAGYLR